MTPSGSGIPGIRGGPITAVDQDHDAAIGEVDVDIEQGHQTDCDEPEPGRIPRVCVPIISLLLALNEVYVSIRPLRQQTEIKHS